MPRSSVGIGTHDLAPAPIRLARNLPATIVMEGLSFGLSRSKCRGAGGLLCRGGGAAEAMGVSDEVDVHVGTLSKAVGGHGGFVACSARLKRLLLSRGRSYIFSTAPPAPVVAASLAAMQVNEQVGLSL